MCERCAPEATGLRLGGIGPLSWLFGLHSCDHSPECECSDCERYRDKNKYADTGIHFNRPKVK